MSTSALILRRRRERRCDRLYPEPPGVEAIFIDRPRLACAGIRGLWPFDPGRFPLRDPRRLRASRIIECVEPSTRSSHLTQQCYRR